MQRRNGILIGQGINSANKIVSKLCFKTRLVGQMMPSLGRRRVGGAYYSGFMMAVAISIEYGLVICLECS